MKRPRPLERLLMIDEMILADDSYPSVAEFMQRFQISERAVYDDIHYLKQRFQAPLAYSRKHGGYYYVLKGWSLRIRALKERQNEMVKSPNDYPQIAFRPGELTKVLVTRSQEQTNGAYAQTAKQDLSDYYHFLRVSLPHFTTAERAILRMALNGWLAGRGEIDRLWLEVEAVCDDEVFIERIRSFTPFECWSIVQAFRTGSL